MLRNVIVVSMGGLVLFSKEFAMAAAQVCGDARGASLL